MRTNTQTPGGSGMFRLKMINESVFQIHAHNGTAFEGTPLAVFGKAVELGVNESELSYAVALMDELGHDYADFGMFGTFLYSGLTSRKKVA